MGFGENDALIWPHCDGLNWPHLCVGQGDEHDPAVVGVAFALDPPALLEALDEQRHRRLGQALELCELGDTPRRIGQRPGHPGFGARHIGPNLPDEQARIATALSVIMGSASGGVAGAVMQSFTDLADGLPGIGTNILTNCLAGLQEQGVGEKRTLPRPTPVAVYELTDAGRALAPVLRELRAWGARFGPAPRRGDSVQPAWIVQSAAGRNPRLGPGRGCELRVGDDSFSLTGTDDGVDVRAGTVATPRPS
jgi:DNA-binding HxlR family transcriptional regulator